MRSNNATPSQLRSRSRIYQRGMGAGRDSKADSERTDEQNMARDRVVPIVGSSKLILNVGPF